ncbi:hypothetical protein V5N11_009207 [Cardamine amara subsp. amara]|uniref:Uncharacterized protein n=1 Tax=Cardamine amara subsp. amara TaxID=228776 RepID=A0ABD1AJ51_CARAN
MSITLTHCYLVRDVYAVPFLTKHGIGFYYFSRNSILHVPQKIFPLYGFKRFCYPQKVSSTPSNPSDTVKSQSKPDPVDEKPIQEPSQEREFFGGSVTMGAAPSPRHVPIPTFLRQRE